MSHPKLTVYENLQTIRLTASVLYDRGRAMDRSHEQLADDIAPLLKHRKEMVKHAIANDLSGVICAIKQLQADAKSHLATAQYLKEKAEDSTQHARNLLDALKKDLQEKNADSAADGDFSVTLINGDVTIR